jgi:hypothetical protein
MANDKPTPDQSAAEKIGRAIDGQIFRLDAEDAQLAQASQRRADIAAERAVLVAEKAKIDPRRPSKPAASIDAIPVADTKGKP